MNTTEQIMEKMCPATGNLVRIRIIYDVAQSKACPVFVDPVFRECLEDGNCQEWEQGNGQCLLFEYPPGF